MSYIPPYGPSVQDWIRQASSTLNPVLAQIEDMPKSLRSYFGAKGDGADDTRAFDAARDYIISTGRDVVVPFGTFLTDPFTLYETGYAIQGSLRGMDRERSIIQRLSTGGGAFITRGDPAATIFQAGVGVSNLTIDGGATSNGDTFVGYDVVNADFTGVYFKGGAIACHLYGGVDLEFYSCLFDAAGTGFKAEKFTSAAGGGWPNFIKHFGSRFTNNAGYGADFDHGRLLQFFGSRWEVNGTTLAAAQGGLHVGANVGQEVTATDPLAQGVVVNGGWFEANLGTADIHLESGINAISDTTMFSTSTQTTNDIKIDGGKYEVANVNAAFAKTANLLEGASVASGNIIRRPTELANMTYNAAKTTVE